MTPVRRRRQVEAVELGVGSSAMNIVGTPYSAVQRSASTASSTCGRVERVGAGSPSSRRASTQPRLPITMPKQ